MRTLTLVVFSTLMLMQNILLSQISISLVEIANFQSNQDCYEIQLENVSQNSVDLLGQNYRLYYDSEVSKLDETSISSYLNDSYESLKLVQHFYDVDTKGAGLLSYDSHLGFINISTDFDETSTNAIELFSNKAMPVAKMCFDIKSGEVPMFNWGRNDLTHNYATAFVEIAVSSDNKNKSAEISQYSVRLRDNRLLENAQWISEYYPNPFTDILTVELNRTLQSQLQVDLTDDLGRLLKSITVPKGVNKFTVDASDLISGVYFIKLSAVSNPDLKENIKVLKVN